MPDVAKIFDRESENWDADHGPDSPRAFEFQARAKYLRAVCAHFKKPRVLDIGCGTGRQLLDLAGSISGGMGLDLSEGMITQAREHARRSGADAIEFQTGDAIAVRPEVLGRFDLIMFVGSLEHAPEPAGQLAAAGTLLEPDGKLIVIMPHPWNPSVFMGRFSAVAREGAPFRHLTPRHLSRLAAQSGLQLEVVSGLPYRATNSVDRAIRHRWPIVAGAYVAQFRPAVA